MEAVGAILTFVVFLFAGLLLYMPIYNNYYDTYGIRLRARKKEVDLVSPPKSSGLLRGSRAAGKFALSLFPGLIDERTRLLLSRANYRSQDHMFAFIGIKVLLVSTVGSLTMAGSAGNLPKLLLIVPVAVCTWMMPNFFLASSAKQRQQHIITELPTIVDLLIVCAQAGMGILLSIDKVGKECADSCPYLAEELQQLIRDIRTFAKPTSSALSEMAERCGAEELGSVVSTLIACDAKGSELAYPLKQVSLSIRDRIKRKREEEASKIPVKMVPVIMLFIMPLILCPMLGPAIIIILEALKPAFSNMH